MVKYLSYLFFLYITTVFTQISNANDINNNTANHPFYNETRDVDENGSPRRYKNYAKIGSEDYSQKNIWRKFYAGIDINWWLKRVGDDVKEQIFYTNFWKRFQNLDVYFGSRIYRFFGAETGYVHFGNLTAKDGKKHNIDGMYINAIVYSPMLNLTYTTLEGYMSIGGSVLFSGINDGKPKFSGKFGAGIILTLYKSMAFNLGIDYYTPIDGYAKKGLFAIKTGFNFYLNI